MGLLRNYILLCILLSKICLVSVLNNGLALTPPMGWIPWDRYGCNTNCTVHPDKCISESLFKRMAHMLVKDGYRDAGYVHINLDDCWMAPYRDKDENLVGDPIRFPHGILSLSNYIHELGLKFGIYQDYGPKTCMGYPGIKNHLKQDAERFNEWGIDMIKVDGCHTHPNDLDPGYIDFGKYLNSTSRPIIYSCSWPYYQYINKMEPSYELVSKYCNMWRNYHDIGMHAPHWESILDIIDHFGDFQEHLSRFTGPGRWSDADMIVIGNADRLSLGQARVQMGVWSILPSPLLMSNDLEKIPKEFKDILLNKDVIAINQDRLGIPGKRVFKEDDLEIWKRPVLPKKEQDTSFALLFFNRGRNGKDVTLSLEDFDINYKLGYNITSLFTNFIFDNVLPGHKFIISVPPEDIVMLKCTIL